VAGLPRTSDTVHASDVSPGRLAETAAELGPLGPLRTHVVDVTDFPRSRLHRGRRRRPTAVGVRELRRRLRRYAGVDETSPELWHRVLEVNLTGCFHGCKAASAVMAPRGRGRIVSIGSVAGVHGGADGLSYAASKAGIEGMTRRLALDLGRSGVTANVVAPGVISTAIRANSAEVLGDLVDVDRGVGTSSDKMDWLIPVGRPGRADEVAAAVLYLAGDEAAYITGQVLRIDGGWDAT
jgi:NAD(P)-dependent dehydrogenase (short-subunit alcohol dehydrogenase family)